jgi:hypothetical protein
MVMGVGLVLFFLNGWILTLPLSLVTKAAMYITNMAAGYIGLLMAGLWMSRLLKYNLMDDVFNNENESFMQETRLLANEYSVNLPTRFYYKKKWNNGWINSRLLFGT